MDTTHTSFSVDDSKNDVALAHQKNMVYRLSDPHYTSRAQKKKKNRALYHGYIYLRVK